MEEQAVRLEELEEQGVYYETVSPKNVGSYTYHQHDCVNVLNKDNNMHAKWLH